MASRNGKANPRKAAQAGGVKSTLPKPSRKAVARALRKTETLSFRLTAAEKDSIRAAAASVGMAITEYLVKCHEVVSVGLSAQKGRNRGRAGIGRSSTLSGG